MVGPLEEEEYDTKTLSSFSAFYGSKVHESCDIANAHLQSQFKEEHISDSCDESISDEDNFAATENCLAYHCDTSRLGENYNSSIKCGGSEISKWNQILEDSSVLDFLPNKSNSPLGKGKTKLKFSIHSNSNKEHSIQELKSKKENSCNKERMKSANNEVHYLEDVKEEDDTAPYNMIPYKKKEGPHPSMAELLEGLQGKSCTPSFLHSNVLAQKARDREAKKRRLPNLGERTLENEEDPPAYMAGDTSSDDEEINQNHFSLVPQQIEGQRPTMADIFQEAFNASNGMEPVLPATKLSGNNYHGRLLEVIQLEKERHADFSRFSHALHSSSSEIDKSTGITVQIISRALEGRLIVCHCLFQFSVDSKKLFEGYVDEEAKQERTVIFNSKICDNVDLVVGNLVHIYPPWKEVLVKEEKIILCTYFSNDIS